MRPKVEPLDGPELDRLITALLNATGAVHRIVEEEDRDRDPEMSGEEVIGCCAKRLRSILSLFAEHRDDGDLAEITEFLAFTSIFIAQQGGFAGVFRDQYRHAGEGDAA